MVRARPRAPRRGRADAGDGELVIHLRGELAAMLALCAEDEQQKAPAADAMGALQIKMVAGTRNGRDHTLRVVEI